MEFSKIYLSMTQNINTLIIVRLIPIVYTAIISLSRRERRERFER